MKGSVRIAPRAKTFLIAHIGAGKWIAERANMRAKGAIVFMLMLAGLVGYLLFEAMGIWWGVLAVCILPVGFFLYQFIDSRPTEGKPGWKWMSIAAVFGDGLRMGRWRDARARERRARLEALQVKAHLLARHRGDTYGAQSCCLELISQTDKGDPLFVDACDLYMSTVINRSRQGLEFRPRIPSSISAPGVRTVPLTNNIIPFPPKADQN